MQGESALGLTVLMTLSYFLVNILTLLVCCLGCIRLTLAFLLVRLSSCMMFGWLFDILCSFRQLGFSLVFLSEGVLVVVVWIMSALLC